MFFFTWEDRFLLSQELHRWKKWFFDKFWESAVSQYDKENFDDNKIMQDLSWSDIFSSKKMIIFKGYPADSTTDNKLTTNQINFLDNIIDDIDKWENLIVFISIKPDKRKKGYKIIDKKCKKKIFWKLKKPELIENIIKWSEETINKSTASKLIDMVWNNTWKLRNETMKIMTVCQVHNKKATDKLLDMIINKTNLWDPFAMMDKIFFKPQDAIKILENLQKNWENRNLLMWTLLRWCRNVILYIDCANSGMQSSGEIAKKIGAHPFVISKYKAKKNELTKIQTQIDNFFQLLLEIDFSLKNWRLPEQWFRLEVKKWIAKFV